MDRQILTLLYTIQYIDDQCPQDPLFDPRMLQHIGTDSGNFFFQFRHLETIIDWSLGWTYNNHEYAYVHVCSHMNDKSSNDVTVGEGRWYEQRKEEKKEGGKMPSGGGARITMKKQKTRKEKRGKSGKGEEEVGRTKKRT